MTAKRYPFASLVNLVNDDVPRVLFNMTEVGPFEDVMVCRMTTSSLLSADKLVGIQVELQGFECGW